MTLKHPNVVNIKFDFLKILMNKNLWFFIIKNTKKNQILTQINLKNYIYKLFNFYI